MASDWTIWKFPLPTDTDRFEVVMPPAFNLTVQIQHGKPVLWAAVLPEADDGERWPRRFVWVGTGRPVPDDITAFARSYRGTVQLNDGALVLHLFEVMP